MLDDGAGRKLDEALQVLLAKQRTMLGYPLNMTPLPLSRLRPFLRFVLNNLGDAFVGGSYGLNTFGFEREVVHWFASLWHLPREQAWGYVTSGGSEGNLRGLSLGRERFPDAVFYASDRAHYSVAKAVRLMGGRLETIRTDAQHRMSLIDLWNVLETDRPAVVCATVGTTMAGAVDDVAGVLEVLRAAGVKGYVHVDAALSGLLLPFLPSAPLFDFHLPVDSISVSGHKMLGCPLPCGAFVSRVRPVSNEVEYLGSRDTTTGGSRSGFAALLLWYALQYYGKAGLAEMVRHCREMTAEALVALRAIGWPCWSADHSNTVMIRRPHAAVVEKWQLAVSGDEAHIVCMPHVSEAMVAGFVKDLENSRSTKEEMSCSVLSLC